MSLSAGPLQHCLAHGENRRWTCLLIALCGVLGFVGCRSEPTSRTVATQCVPAGPQESALTLISPAHGVLSISVEERGVSVVASLDDEHMAAASPVERFGTIVLVAPSARGESHTLRVRAEDSPDITGSVCFTAKLMSSSQRAGIRAAEEFAQAGRDVRAGNWRAAFDRYLNAARLFDSLHAERFAAVARHAMAEIAYLRLDNKRDSYALASEALRVLGRQSEDPAVAGALAGLQAKALLDMPGTDFRVIAPEVETLLASARRRDGDSRYGARELPRLEIMRGFLAYRLDAPSRAREVFASAAAMCRTGHDWDCFAIASQNLALLAAETNNYSTALAAYADALQLLPPDLDPKLAADIWNNFGRVQGIVGLFSSSERSHATAMRAYARLGDCPGVRRSLSWSGNLLVQIGTLSDAEDYLQRAASRICADLLTSSTDAPGVSTLAERNFGPRSRIDPCQHPLDPQTLSPDNKMIVFNSLLSLGGALMLEGDTALAQRCIDAAEPYAVTARTRMRLANARGSLFLERKDATAARAEFESSLRVADQARLAAKYEYRGVAQLGLMKAQLLAGHATEAVESGFETLRASVGRGDIDQTVTSLRLIAAGLRGAQHPAEAAHTLEAAANLVEGVPIDELDGERRATYLATQHTVFAELTDLYASQAATDIEGAWPAFVTSERGRARSLRFAVTQAARDASSAAEAPPAARYQQLLHDVVNISNPDTPAGLKSLPDALDRAAQKQRTDVEMIDRDMLMRTLKRLDATLVEYAVGANDMFAFVVADGNVSVARLGSRHEIEHAALTLQDRIRDAETPASDVREAAQELARQVLWPLNGRVRAKRIILVPDDALHTIPFNVLPWSSDSKDLVVNHVELSVVPSALFLTHIVAMPPARDAAPRIELIGDPVFRMPDWRRECVDSATGRPAQANRAFTDWTDSLPRLPGSRAEVQVVARLARQSRPGSHVDMLLGCAAVPSALRRAARDGMDLLHIATHARVDSQRPRLSALALTPEGPAGATSGAFGLLDILGLKLHSSLVVLSACETSRGRLLPGEGVLGPAQAFLQSGASAVLASYWRVDDEATSNFMQRFYRHLLLEHLPAAAALRKSQLERAAESRAFDWAAFALYGRPDSGL